MVGSSSQRYSSDMTTGSSRSIKIAEPSQLDLSSSQKLETKTSPFSESDSLATAQRREWQS